MLPIERQNKILKLLNNQDIVKIQELVDEFNISIETVRRDLAALEEQDKIEKVYGGAKLKKKHLVESTLQKRLIENQLQKEKIGKKCSELIEDGDCIYIDSGSTTFQVSKFIKTKKDLTVITNSIPVVNELMNTAIDVIIIGGKIRHNEQSIVTFDYIFNFNGLNIQKSFICAAGISLDNGISDFNMQEAVTRKEIIKRSNNVYIAADSSKFNKNVMVNIAPLNKIDYIVTDDLLAPNEIEKFNNTETKIILA